MQIGHFTDISAEASGLVLLPIQWTSGGTGAVPALSTFQYNQHLVSVTRNSAGNFTLVFDTGAVGFLGLASDNVIQATPAGGGLWIQVMSQTLTTATSGWAVTIQTQNPAGTATDPASGDIIVFTLLLQYFDAIRGV